MGILRHNKDKPGKAKRASRKAASRSGKVQGSSGTKAAGSATTEPPKTPAKAKRRRAVQTPAGAPTVAVDKRIDSVPGQDAVPPILSTGAAAFTSQNSAKRQPTGPALSGSASAIPGERRRWPERPGPGTNHSDTKKTGSDSRSEAGDASEPPPRANKLVPTNAVHPTERRIKRRMHKNGALMAAAAAALLGVLILSNQSEPPELVLGDRQIASRLPAGQDWRSDVTSDTISEAASRGSVPDSESPSVTAAAPPERTQPTAAAGELSAGDIVEMERMLSRLDLAAGAPDGVVDDETAQAIRLYQEIAGLPVDGEASQDLLADMREVVKILDGNN